jgi:hypothetical protein
MGIILIWEYAKEVRFLFGGRQMGVFFIWGVREYLKVENP